MNISYNLYNNPGDLDALKDLWCSDTENPAFKGVIERNYEYFRFLMKEQLLDGEPLVFVMRVEDNPVILTAGRIRKITYSPSFGYLKLNFIKFHKISFQLMPYSVIGETNNKEIAVHFIKGIIPELKKKKIDYLFFDSIPSETMLADNLLKNDETFIKDPLPFMDEHFILETPESLAGFLAGKDSRTRYNLKYLMKQIQTDFQDNVFVKVFTTEDEVDIFFNCAEQVAKNSQLRALDVGFRNTPGEYKKKKWLAQNGFFRSYVLYLSGTPAAFINGINYNGRFYAENIGFDLNYKKYRPGTYLRLKMIEDIAQNKNAVIIDYGYGSEEYKKSFSSLCVKEIRIKMFVPGLSNRIFIATIILFNYLNGLIRKLLKISGLYRVVKKFYRSVKQRLYFNTSGASKIL